MTPLIFATGNEYKYAEASVIAAEFGFALEHLSIRLLEVQTQDINVIVDRKAKDAYSRFGRPLFVEHTSLHIEFANGFLGGLARTFLKTLGDERVCELFGTEDRNAAVGRTTIGYCDGRRVQQVQGDLKGVIAKTPKGSLTDWEQFGWSRIFIPAGHKMTLSELGMAEKNKISMRREALTKLATLLRTLP